MKKIAFLIEDISELSGGKRVAVNLANELSKHYNVSFITWYNKKNVFELLNTINIYYLLLYKSRMRYDYFKLIKKLNLLIKREKIEELIVVGRFVSIISFFAVFNTKCKLIICEHNSIKGYNTIAKGFKNKIVNIFILLCYKFFVDKIVFLTRKDLEEYKKKNIRISDKLINIYNSLDNKLFCNVKNYSLNSKKIITVGRIDYQKGYEYLIKVAKFVFSKHPDWQWHIYGDGVVKYKNQIIDLINQNNLQNNIILQGNRSDIYDLYQNYSFYVMTSRYEGLPMVLLEAKAKKLPIVSFDINSGPSDIVRDGVDGFLVEAFDCNVMADRICELIENSELRQKFSDNAHGNIDKFSKEKIIKQWCDFIENI